MQTQVDDPAGSLVHWSDQAGHRFNPVFRVSRVNRTGYKPGFSWTWSDLTVRLWKPWGNHNKLLKSKQNLYFELSVEEGSQLLNIMKNLHLSMCTVFLLENLMKQHHAIWAFANRRVQEHSALLIWHHKPSKTSSICPHFEQFHLD